MDRHPKAVDAGALLKGSLMIAALWAVIQQAFHLFVLAQPFLARNLAGWFFGALFTALVFGVLAANLPWPPAQRFAVISLTLFVINTLSTHIELRYFSTLPMSDLLTQSAMGLLRNLAMAAAVTYLFRPSAEQSTVGSDIRSLFSSRHAVSWLWRLAVADITYVFTYMFFGGIAFHYTRPYYTDPRYGLHLTLPTSVAFLYELQMFRSLLYLVVSMLLISGLRMSRFKLAVLMGLVLWVTGGLAPLVGAQNWPLALRYYHTLEILSQNFTTGFIFAYLFSSLARIQRGVEVSFAS